MIFHHANDRSSSLCILENHRVPETAPEGLPLRFVGQMVMKISHRCFRVHDVLMIRKGYNWQRKKYNDAPFILYGGLVLHILNADPFDILPKIMHYD